MPLQRMLHRQCYQSSLDPRSGSFEFELNGFFVAVTHFDLLRFGAILPIFWWNASIVYSPAGKFEFERAVLSVTAK